MSVKEDKDRLHSTEAAGDQNLVSYPKGIPFIIVNEFCERFNNHGIRCKSRLSKNSPAF